MNQSARDEQFHSYRDHARICMDDAGGVFSYRCCWYATVRQQYSTGGWERERERREMEIFVRVCVCLVQGDWLVQLGWILVRARAERSRGGGGAKDETELWVGCQPLALQQSEGVEDERATANCLRVCHSTVLCFFFSLHLSSRV
jgi:hypothetical protein